MNYSHYQIAQAVMMTLRIREDVLDEDKNQPDDTRTEWILEEDGRSFDDKLRGLILKDSVNAYGLNNWYNLCDRVIKCFVSYYS